MIGDARFRMPPVDGQLDTPEAVVDYFGSVGNAIASAFQSIIEKLNDPRLIIVRTGSGMRPLSEAIGAGGWRPGDLKASVGRRSKVLRQLGWVLCNNRNGAPDSHGALVLGAAEADDGGTEASGSSTTGLPVPADTEGPSPADTEGPSATTLVLETIDDGCSVVVDVGSELHLHGMSSHTHPLASHVHGVSTPDKSFTVIWMMKL